MKQIESRIFNPDEYDYYVNQYILKSEQFGVPISHSKLRKQPFNLPDARWYVKYCPDESVTTWAKFVDWCGFVANNCPPSKEKVIDLIYQMQSNVNRPLMYDDFRGRGCYHVPIEIVREYWGTINNMKKDLGLEINQESMMDRHLSSKEEFDNMIADICNYARNENRDFITTREINSNPNWVSANSLQKTANKFYNCKLQDVLANHSISLGKQGCGISFDFEDGELVTSQFEYMFSKYLRDCGLKYNIDYFRDIKYSAFIPDCKNNMNCDYVIHIGGKVLYIEIAGILAEYKTWFYADKPISRSKSKERYRLKLKKKEEMLKSNNLIYFILFPCDLTKENFENILENGSLDLKKSIEKFNQNNIDWVKIRETGELDYSKSFLRDTRPKKEAV